jgi:phosphotransferase system enzyme I (PtsP)
MFPMISSLEEFNSAKNIVNICSRELEQEGIPYAQNPSLGMMVEVPSVIELIDTFAETVDFFSIGTNDFIQYILAVDRTNEQLSDSYIAHNPAVLRALEKVIASCNKHGKEVSICGDMANKPEYLAFLLGAGIRELSIEPSFFPRIQNEIEFIDTAHAEKFSRKILKCSAVADIEAILFGKS